MRQAADDDRASCAACKCRPGYREALAAGLCQRCHRTGVGVRMAGLRPPDRTTWTRLSLCPSCIEAGWAEGYVMLSGEEDAA
jgi:hypothetical protein